MGDHASESLAGQPRVQAEGLGLDLEDFRPAWLELKDRLFAGRAKQCLCRLIFSGSAGQCHRKSPPDPYAADLARRSSAQRGRGINAAAGERARRRDVQVGDLSDKNGARG